MLFSRWQKQNTQFKNTSWVIAAVAAFIIALFFRSSGPETMGGVAVALAFVFRFTLSFIANRFYPDSMSGALKVDYEEISRRLNTTLKENAFHFYATSHKKAYSYEFPDQDLVMMIKPHKVTGSKGELLDATMVTFQNLGSQNRVFAEKITSEIDELVTQLTEQ